MEFLDDSIGSIIAQTHNKWELLVGINGHAKGSAKPIVDKIKSFNDKRIKVFIIKQQGKVKTLNALANRARYSHICIMDVDDKWSPNKLAEQIKVVDKYDVIGSDVEYFGDRDGSPGLFLGKLSSQMFSFQNPVVNSSVMIHRQDALWDEKWEGLDDYCLWIKLLNKGRKFFNVPQVLTYHRIHNDSYFNNKNGDMGTKMRESLPKLTEEQWAELYFIIDNKKWAE